MSRRQTLEPLSNNQLNNRPSLANSRQSLKPSSGRPSLAPQTNERSSNAGIDRRSSAFASHSAVKQDPRPLGDKNFQNSCIRTVIAYLSSNGYPYAVSPKVLSSPTGKDFAQIVQFLFQKFDPSLKVLGKVEDEVRLFLKRLCYPFQISKSALFAVGSPHSWPSVLAALTWLVELLNYEDKAEAAPAQSFEDNQYNDKEFAQYVSTSYQHFLAGEDDKSQAADDKMLGQFTQKETVLLGSLDTLKQV